MSTCLAVDLGTVEETEKQVLTSTTSGSDDDETTTGPGISKVQTIHCVNAWRRPYFDHPVHREFRTFIYSFTWEDPEVDMQHLKLTDSDSVLVITSAGDNALHYATSAAPRQIHCVDINPCQGHLLELKLASIKSLSFPDFFSLFGRGWHPHFETLLETKIAPHLSSDAYKFWKDNKNAFSSSFYLRGYSGWALWLANVIFTLAGVKKDVKRMCECNTLEEQASIWKTKLRPVWLNPIVVTLLRSPTFCWNALGVPMNQRKMLLEDGGIYEYVCDTLDPLLSTYLLKTQNYFYLLTLLGHYTPSCCPAYLTLEGFQRLKANHCALLDTFYLHTDSILNVLKGMSSSSLNRAVIMDHLDWFAPGSPEVDEEVAQFHRVINAGGFVLWRSAARKPWYIDVFLSSGFDVKALGVRGPGSGVALDRVNMYASFWQAMKGYEDLL